MGQAGVSVGQVSAVPAAEPATAESRTAILVYIAWQELDGAVLDSISAILGE